MYGGGLRVRECVTLRVKDVDLDRREIVVRGGKGDKDRRTPLAEACVAPLKRALDESRLRFRKDERAGVRTTGISPALLRKYPNADAEWRWSYIFGAARTVRPGRCSAPAPLSRISAAAVGCECGAGRRDHKAGDLPLVTALVCDASSRGRGGHSNCTDALGAHGPSHDDDLHARSESRGLGRPEPGGFAVGWWWEAWAVERECCRAASAVARTVVQRVLPRGRLQDKTEALRAPSLTGCRSSRYGVWSVTSGVILRG